MKVMKTGTCLKAALAALVIALGAMPSFAAEALTDKEMAAVRGGQTIVREDNKTCTFFKCGTPIACDYDANRGKCISQTQNTMIGCVGAPGSYCEKTYPTTGQGCCVTVKVYTTSTNCASIVPAGQPFGCDEQFLDHTGDDGCTYPTQCTTAAMPRPVR